MLAVRRSLLTGICRVPAERRSSWAVVTVRFVGMAGHSGYRLAVATLLGFVLGAGTVCG